MILDGTEKSLKAALNLLKQFYIMSGLKINVDKTRALWIGSSCGSPETLCEEFALDWSQDPLKILGVTFSPLVFNIWDLNSQEILLKIKKLLNHWSKRKLTLLYIRENNHYQIPCSLKVCSPFYFIASPAKWTNIRIRETIL